MCLSVCLLLSVMSSHYVLSLNKRPAQDNVVCVCVSRRIATWLSNRVELSSVIGVSVVCSVDCV